MEQLSARILERSSDAIVIVRLADGTLLGANEAFFAVTGHRQHELVRRDVNDLFVPLEPIEGWKNLGWGEELAEFSDAPIGLWTRAGELRYGQLSTLILRSDGQADAVCAIRDIRDPTPGERRLAARERVVRTLAADDPPLEVAARAIRALGESLRWEFGALWLKSPASAASLRCTVVWRSPLADLQALEEASWRTTVDPGVGLVGRCWGDGQALWVTDAGTVPDLDPRLQLEQAGEQLHGWFGFPVRAGAAATGIIEFFSPEARQQDEELLEMTEDLGSWIGRFLENPQSRAAPAQRTVAPDLWTRHRSLEGPPGDIVWSAVRDLAASIGRLDQLLERAAQPQGDLEPEEAADTSLDAGVPLRISTGLTLKAVSRRTGVPAATLRTWERRYGFVDPTRSANGYRLYGDEEIARVLQVKQLQEQGVRLGEAMAMVRAAEHPQAG
jgi:PAS domain S-box-containing protein